MKVLIVSGNPKKKGALASLVGEAARGATDGGAQVEEARITALDIGYCRFCLQCHDDVDSPIARCALADDMPDLLEKVRAADGLILACPASGGHANAVMKTFIERTTWTLGRPTRNVLWVKGCPESRITDKQRYAVTITTAGVVPTWSRAVCNGSTREMSSHAEGIFNAKVVRRVYAGSIMKRGFRPADMRRAYAAGRELAEAMSGTL